MDAFNSKRKVYITALRDNPSLLTAKEFIRKYSIVNFDIAKTIDEAEIVLYLENGYIGLAELPQLLAHVRSAPSAMHFLFVESDWPFPVLPGAYPSLTRPYPWAQSWSFLLRHDVARNDEDISASEPEFLFSFLGRVSTHPIRNAVLALDTEKTPCLDVTDALRRFSNFDYSQTYLTLIKRSKFVLCPRGLGASSIRIFEAMCCGRVPVIISDHWQPPVGIPWETFCVRVQESDVHSVPTLLHRLQERAHLMGQLAQQAFNDNFAPNIFFDRLLVSLLSNYSTCSFTTEAILQRAWQAVGLRELRSLCHQTRSWVLDRVSAA
jgi:Exostosin family